MRTRRFGRVLLLGLTIFCAVEAESSAMVRRLFRRSSCCDRCEAGKTTGKGDDADMPPPAAPKAPPTGGNAGQPDVPLPPVEDRGPLADVKDLGPLTTP